MPLGSNAALILRISAISSGLLKRNSSARFEARINEIVYDAVVARGGSISAEHGIGTFKRDELAARKSPVALDMMRAIKNALDPAGVLNPGRVLRPPATP